MPYYEFTIAVADRFKDHLIKKLTDSGCLGVIEQDEAIIAYFPGAVDVKTINGDLSLMIALIEKSGEANGLTFGHQLIPDQDWNESWEKGFVPIHVGERFTILPPWEKKREGRINLIIDPAMAFGTGHHETTRSCLLLMGKYAAQGGKESFLDVGTGTGILAIAAAKLGYARVIGVDTDVLAVDAARKNAELNHTEDVEIREGSIANLNETYEFIAANILSGVLILLAPALALHMKPEGIAVLSGILLGQEEEIIDAMNMAGLKLLEQYQDGKWISLAVARR